LGAGRFGARLIKIGIIESGSGIIEINHITEPEELHVDACTEFLLSRCSVDEND